MNMNTPYTLPYLNNWKLIVLTIGINSVFAFIFWHPDFGIDALLWDTVYCAVITTFLDVFIISRLLQKRREKGILPRNVPTSRLICLLPRNPFGLSVIFALIFMAIMCVVNSVLFRFYALQTLSLSQFIVWKSVYSLVLSVWIIEYAIFRMVQADCGQGESSDHLFSETVRNPMPRIAWFTSFFQGMIFDFGFNVAVGLLFGGTVIHEMMVILLPTPCRGSGMLISTSLTGVIVAFFVIPTIALRVMTTMREHSVPLLDKADRFFARIPRNRWLLTLFMLPFFVLSTVLVCGGIFVLFDFDSLNFFQFYLIRVFYISMLCRAVLPFIIRRYRQPDIADIIQQNS